MKETTCIVTASLTKGMELLSHCYHILNTRGLNKDMVSLFQMMSKEQCVNNDMHIKKHSDWLMDNDIIMMTSDWLIDNDMHIKKCFDWLALWGS